MITSLECKWSKGHPFVSEGYDTRSSTNIKIQNIRYVMNNKVVSQNFIKEQIDKLLKYILEISDFAPSLKITMHENG